MVTGLAVLRAYAFTFGVFQVSLFTETTDDTLEGTHCWWFGVGTIGYAGGSTCQILGIGTAFFFDGKSRGGDSKAEGTGTEK